MQRVIRTIAVCGAMLCGLAQVHAEQIRYEADSFDQGAGDSRMWVDFDNDGKDDYCTLIGSSRDNLRCYSSTGSSFNTTPFQLNVGAAVGGSARWVDVDGDGRVDLCRHRIVQTTGTVECRLGGGFTTVVTLTIPIWRAATVNGQGNETPASPGLSQAASLFFVDADADGRADVCYEHRNIDFTHELRCHLSVGNGFAAASSAWTRTGFDPGELDWPRGFHDFNGDTYPDFCRILPGGPIRCTLGGPNGFAAGTDITSTAWPQPYAKEGLAFIDSNGDGKTDLCGIVNSGGNRIACRLSNGRGWEAAQPMSPVLDPGHAAWRWWVDINGDGLVDFCRAVGANPTSSSDFYDNTSHLWCRLNYGGGDLAGSPAFAYDDIKFQDVNFGRADGGRAFCDPNGTGVQTFCRVTRRAQATGGQVCYEGESSTQCYTPIANMTGLYTGVADGVQARQPLMASYTDGLGAETRVTYLPMTHPMVYKRSEFGTWAKTLVALPKSYVVFESRAWQRQPGTPEGQWMPLTGHARYFYKDLRYDPRTGSRGLRERWMLTEGSNTIDHTVYYQGLGPAIDLSSIENDAREVGQVKFQERYAVAADLLPPLTLGMFGGTVSDRAALLGQELTLAATLPAVQPAAPSASSPFILLQRTTHTLGQTQPVNDLYRPVVSSKTESWDWNGSSLTPLPTVDSGAATSDLGNVMTLTQTTTHEGREWKKTTTNTYADNAGAWILGRLSNSTVVSTAPSVADQLGTHARSAGNSPSAQATSGTSPPAPQPQSPAMLSAILQLLLDD